MLTCGVIVRIILKLQCMIQTCRKTRKLDRLMLLIDALMRGVHVDSADIRLILTKER